MARVDALSTGNGPRLRGRRRLGRYIVFGLLAGVFLARCDDISGDEFLCEEAVAKLQECCGATNPGVVGLRCYYNRTRGCGATRPHVGHATAVCLLDHSCEELKKYGTCNSDGWKNETACCESRDAGTVTCCTNYKEPTCPGL